MLLSEVVWHYGAGGHALELQKEKHEMLPGQQSLTVEMPDSLNYGVNYSARVKLEGRVV